jgi:hypothetical protein
MRQTCAFVVIWVKDPHQTLFGGLHPRQFAQRGEPPQYAERYPLGRNCLAIRRDLIPCLIEA